MQGSHLLLQASYLLTQCLDLLRPKRCPAYLEITGYFDIPIKGPCRFAFAQYADTIGALTNHTEPAINIRSNNGCMLRGVVYRTHRIKPSALSKYTEPAINIRPGYACMLGRHAYSTHTICSLTNPKHSITGSRIFTKNARHSWVSRYTMIRLGHKKPPVLFALVDIAVFSSRAVTPYLSTREVKSL